MEERSYDTKMSWCTWFMSRRGLTIRRISHSGRKHAVSSTGTVSVELVTTVFEVVMKHCFDPHLGLAPKRTVFNMDQTSIYYMSPRTTEDFVGATCVPTATEGAESYRSTMALTMAADARKLPPHFVFMGQPVGDVEMKFRGYCDASVTTFSVQAKAWFDLQVMLDWIENVRKCIVTEPSVLIRDSLKVHKMVPVLVALACTGTTVMFVPGGCTGVAQAAACGHHGPFETAHPQPVLASALGSPTKLTPAQRRRNMFDRAMAALDNIRRKRCAVHSTQRAVRAEGAPAPG